MRISELQPGDIVYAARTLRNDGSIPHLAENALIAEAGTRGVLINTGHLEDDPNQVLFLVRFEDQTNNLGNPVGVWEDEISAEAPVTAL